MKSSPVRQEPVVAAPQGHEHFRITFASRDDKSSVVTECFSRYPSRVISPQDGARQCASAFVSNYGGGLVAGDRIHGLCKVQRNATGLLTTTGHQLVYGGGRGGTSLTGCVSPGGLLLVVPQVTHLYPRASTRIYTRVLLEASKDDLGSAFVLEWTQAADWRDVQKFESRLRVEVVPAPAEGCALGSQSSCDEKNGSSSGELEVPDRGSPNDKRVSRDDALPHTRSSDTLEGSEHGSNGTEGSRKWKGTRLIVDERIEVRHGQEPVIPRLLSSPPLFGFRCFGVCLMLGPRLAGMVDRLQKEFTSQRRGIERGPDRVAYERHGRSIVATVSTPDVVVTASSFATSVDVPHQGKRCVSGLCLKFLGTSSTDIAAALHELCEEAWSVAGGCPFIRKIVHQRERLFT